MLSAYHNAAKLKHNEAESLAARALSLKEDGDALLTRAAKIASDLAKVLDKG